MMYHVASSINSQIRRNAEENDRKLKEESDRQYRQGFNSPVGKDPDELIASAIERANAQREMADQYQEKDTREEECR